MATTDELIEEIANIESGLDDIRLSVDDLTWHLTEIKEKRKSWQEGNEDHTENDMDRMVDGLQSQAQEIISRIQWIWETFE